MLLKHLKFYKPDQWNFGHVRTNPVLRAMLLFQTLKLVPVLFQHGCFHLKRKTVGTKFSSRLSIFFHLVFLVCGEGAAVDHVVEGEVGDLLQAARRHVQAHLVKSDFRGLQFVVCQLFVVIC